jgi:hypothetical protein
MPAGVRSTLTSFPHTSPRLCFYGHGDKRDAETAKGLTLDQARRIASNLAKLPRLLSKV